MDLRRNMFVRGPFGPQNTFTTLPQLNNAPLPIRNQAYITPKMKQFANNILGDHCAPVQNGYEDSITIFIQTQKDQKDV